MAFNTYSSGGYGSPVAQFGGGGQAQPGAMQAMGNVIASGQQALPGIISAQNQIPLEQMNQLGQNQRTGYSEDSATQRTDMTSARQLQAALQQALSQKEASMYGSDQDRIGQLGAAEFGMQGQIGAAEQNRMGNEYTADRGLEGVLGASRNSLLGSLGGSLGDYRGVQDQGMASRDVARTQAEAAVRQSELGNRQHELKQERFQQILPLLATLLTSIGGRFGGVA